MRPWWGVTNLTMLCFFYYFIRCVSVSLLLLLMFTVIVLLVTLFGKLSVFLQIDTHTHTHIFQAITWRATTKTIADLCHIVWWGQLVAHDVKKRAYATFLHEAPGVTDIVRSLKADTNRESWFETFYLQGVLDCSGKVQSFGKTGMLNLTWQDPGTFKND